MNQSTIITSLKQFFYITFALQVALFISFAFKWINLVADYIEVSTTIERYTLIVTLISIPSALKLFSEIMKKNNHPENIDITSSLYKKAFLARFGILFLVATINIVLFALTFKQNFMLCTLIIFTAYLFCYPSSSFITKKEELTKQNNI